MRGRARTMLYREMRPHKFPIVCPASVAIFRYFEMVRVTKRVVRAEISQFHTRQK